MTAPSEKPPVPLAAPQAGRPLMAELKAAAWSAMQKV
jgi:hypothetical protein